MFNHGRMAMVYHGKTWSVYGTTVKKEEPWSTMVDQKHGLWSITNHG